MTSKFKGNEQHWAYQQGAAAGRENKLSERGLMCFGLSCAATSVDAENTRQWLAGFDAEQAKAPFSAKPGFNEGAVFPPENGAMYEFLMENEFVVAARYDGRDSNGRELWFETATGAWFDPLPPYIGFRKIS